MADNGSKASRGLAISGAFSGQVGWFTWPPTRPEPPSTAPSPPSPWRR